MSTIFVYILLLGFILMPKQIRQQLIIKFGKWSYLLDALVYIFLDLAIFWATNLSYAVFGGIIIVIAFIVDYFQIKHILAMTTPIKPGTPVKKNQPTAKNIHQNNRSKKKTR